MSILQIYLPTDSLCNVNRGNCVTLGFSSATYSIAASLQKLSCYYLRHSVGAVNSINTNQEKSVQGWPLYVSLQPLPPLQPLQTINKQLYLLLNCRAIRILRPCFWYNDTYEVLYKLSRINSIELNETTVTPT